MLLTVVEAILAAFGLVILFFGLEEKSLLVSGGGALIVAAMLAAFVVGRRKTPPERRPNLFLQAGVGLGVVVLLLAWFVDQVLHSSRVSHERSAGATLKTLASAEADFRANDRDNNRIQDYWVGDVAGLYVLTPEGGGEPLKLIELSLAAADEAPTPESARAREKMMDPAPKAAYLYRALLQGPDGTGAYDEGGGRSLSRYGFVAHPQVYGEGRRLTFILNDDGVLWQKDTGGKAVLAWPKDLKAEGWKKLE